MMLILILMNVRYLQNVAASFEKGSNGQNHSLSDSHHPTKIHPAKRSIPHWRDFPYYLENPIMWVQLGSKMAKKVIFIPATSLPTNFSLKTKFLTAIVS